MLGRDEIHVWSASLDTTDDRVDRLRGLLTDDERGRADRFAFAKDRKQFTVGRGLLRIILGHYLREDPARLNFCYNSYGKPALSLGSIRFNLAHSRGVVLFALARDRDVGIDLESIRPEYAYEGIAQRFFAPAEVAVLLGLPAEERERAFFNCWTRKEAYIKARGQGLSLPLDEFEVSLAPGAPAALLATHADPAEAQRWSLRELSPGPGFVGALAVEGNGFRLRLGRWPDDDTVKSLQTLLRGNLEGLDPCEISL